MAAQVLPDGVSFHERRDAAVQVQSLRAAAHESGDVRQDQRAGVLHLPIRLDERFAVVCDGVEYEVTRAQQILKLKLNGLLPNGRIKINGPLESCPICKKPVVYFHKHFNPEYRKAIKQL